MNNMPHVYTSKQIKEKSQLDAKAFVWKPVFALLQAAVSEVNAWTWQGEMAARLFQACSS